MSSLRLLCGERGADILDKDGVRHTRAIRVKRFFQHLGDEYRQLERFERYLRGGGYVLAVPISDTSSKDDIADLLRQQGSERLVFFGRLATEDLPRTMSPAARP